MGRGVQEGTTGVMRVTLCMCTVRMCGAWGCRGASGVPVAAPSPQPVQRHTGFSSRCQLGLVTPGQGVPGLLQPRGSPRTCNEAGGEDAGGWLARTPVPVVILLPVPCPAHGLWCQDCTLTTNSSHCTPKQCHPSDTVCATVWITDPSSSKSGSRLGGGGQWCHRSPSGLGQWRVSGGMTLPCCVTVSRYLTLSDSFRGAGGQHGWVEASVVLFWGPELIWRVPGLGPGHEAERLVGLQSQAPHLHPQAGRIIP